MKFGRRGSTQGESVELALVGRGLVVQGSPSAVAQFADTVRWATREGGRLRAMAAEGLAVANSLFESSKEHREYFTFSDRSMELLREHGGVPAGDGFFHALVHDGAGIAGNIEWKPVELKVDRALAMQTAATSLALQAAIRDVAEAVARVEGKVDTLVVLARSERLGAVVGDQRTLTPLVASVRTTGQITETDWSVVASLGPLIARDIEALRSYVGRVSADSRERSFGRSRSDELENLTDDMVAESLALLALAEHNHAAWDELRLARLAQVEPHSLKSGLAETQDRIQALNRADQSLLDELSETARGLLEPSGFEGLRPVERRRLEAHGVDFARAIDWFAHQRQLDTDKLDVAYPSTIESIRNVGRAAGGFVRRSSNGDHDD